MDYSGKYMKTGFSSMIFIAILISCGCTGEGDEPPQGHVWQEQTDALDKANTVEDKLLESAEQQKLLLDQQTQ